MRIETPENLQIKYARMPYKSLLDAIQASNGKMPDEPELKLAPINQDIDLTEFTRQATVERERKDGKLRGVRPGETYEEALQRFAREDNKPYVAPINPDEDDALDIDMYLNSPEYRRQVIEEGRTPQSVTPDRVLVYDDMIDIDAEWKPRLGEKASTDVATQEAPAVAGMSRPAAEAVKKIDQSALKDRFKNFAAGFAKQAEKNAEKAPVPQQSASETANMIRANAGSSLTPQENSLSSLQEQARRMLMRR